MAGGGDTSAAYTLSPNDTLGQYRGAGRGIHISDRLGKLFAVHA